MPDLSVTFKLKLINKAVLITKYLIPVFQQKKIFI